MTSPAMEVIVRPFAPVIITPPARAPRATGIAADPILFNLGGKGGRSMSITLDKKKVVVKPGKHDLKESGRESTKVRVENEDDPDQFVEFCRADKIKMSPKKPDNPGSSDPSSSHAHSPPTPSGSGGTSDLFAAGDGKLRDPGDQGPSQEANRAAAIAGSMNPSPDSPKESPQEFGYKYPKDKACKSPSEPDKGCGE